MINNDISIPKTRQDYNLIAHDFSTRGAILTSDFKRLGALVQDKDSILDFGCGDGRLLRAVSVKPFQYLGVDISDEMINLARKQFPERTFAVLDESSLRDCHNRFTKIFAIAVLHHLPEELRIATLKQLFDYLKPGGQIIATVWQANPDIVRNKWTPLPNGSSDYSVPYITKDGVRINRYIHLFDGQELTGLFHSAGFINIKTTYSRRGQRVTNYNLEIIAEKP